MIDQNRAFAIYAADRLVALLAHARNPEHPAHHLIYQNGHAIIPTDTDTLAVVIEAALRE
jgi:hypothetical protein